MEISYLVVLLIPVAAFVVFSFLAFRTSRTGRIESAAEVGEVKPQRENTCYECLGASNLDKQHMSECSAACGGMPE